MTKMMTLEELARKIDDFAFDFDPYGYRDAYDSREAGCRDVLDCLINRSDLMISNLEEWITNNEDDETLVSELSTLLHDVRMVTMLDRCRKAHEVLVNTIGKTAADSGICSILSAKVNEGEITLEEGEALLQEVNGK